MKTLALHTNETKSNACEKLKCDLCEKLCFGKTSLYAHRKNSHNQKQEQCDKCNMNFSNLQGKNRHMLEIHEMIKAFKCESCTIPFKRNGALQRHIKRVHQKSRSVQCESCHKTFFDNFALKRHISQVHENAKNNHCKTCNESFKDHRTLNNHIAYHCSVALVRTTRVPKG